MVHVLASVYEMTTKWLGHLSSTGPADARALSLRVCVVISALQQSLHRAERVRTSYRCWHFDILVFVTFS